MRSSFKAAASGIAFALALAAPALAAEQAGAQSGGMQVSGGSATGGPSAASHRAEDLVGSKLLDDSGERIGTLSRIVAEKTGDRLHAVISVGGVLGIGDKEVTIPLADLRAEGDRVLAPAGTTVEQLKTRPAYQSSMYEPVADDRMVWVGPAPGEGGTMAAASFSGLDKDKDGYLSRQEADAQGGLTQRWQSMDRNGDDRIDRAEFSAFEAAGPAEAPKTEPTKPKPTEGGAMPKPAEGGAMPKQGGGAGAY